MGRVLSKRFTGKYMKNILIIILFLLTFKTLAEDKPFSFPFDAPPPSKESHKQFLDLLCKLNKTEQPEELEQIEDEKIAMQITFNNVFHNIPAANPDTCPLIMDIFDYFYKPSSPMNTASIQIAFAKTELPSWSNSLLKLPGLIQQTIKNKTMRIADINLAETTILQQYEFQLSKDHIKTNKETLYQLWSGCISDELRRLQSKDHFNFIKKSTQIEDRFRNSTRTPKVPETNDQPPETHPKSVLGDQ